MSKYHPLLVAEIDAFIDRHGFTDVTFSRQAMSDPHFMRDIRGTRLLRPETEARVRAFMKDMEPDRDNEGGEETPSEKRAA